MEDFFNLEFLTPILVAVGCFAAVFAAISPFLQRNTTSSRLRGVAARREELSRKQKKRIDEQKGGSGSLIEKKSKRIGLMKVLLEQLKLQNQMVSKELRDKLQQAGWRKQSAMITFIFAKLMTPVTFAVLAMFLLSDSDMAFIGKLFVLSLACGAGYYIPGVIVSNTIQKRQQMIKKNFPDAVDLLLICVEAGLSVEAAFSRVTDDMSENNPILGEELGLVSAELAFLAERRQAYENMASRTGLDVAKSLGMALIQSEKYGTPVASALRVVSQESRASRMAFAEKKAGSLPAQLTVPMIVFFLPVLFVVVLGPAIIKVINEVM
ncbi:MAG: type II secretion system F family protein [Alphaproteobacteria bacterium]|nr:type II secretion system F family protein [Alphaproteobacteria bacterium]